MYKGLAVALTLTSALAVTACSQDVSYSKDVKPILTQNCLQCHDGQGQGSTESGLVLVEYDDLMQGTKLGQVVVPGNSVSSTLYRLVAHEADPKLHMPPHHKEAGDMKLTPLSDAQIETIKLWIDQGAKNN